MSFLCCAIFSMLIIFAPQVFSAAEDVLIKQKKIEQLDAKKNQIIRALIKINTKNKKLNYELEKLTKEKELVEMNLKANLQDIKSITTKLTDTRRMLTERIKTLSKFKGENILKSMMMFPKLSQIEKNIKMMGAIASYDMISIQEYYNDKIILKEKIEKSKKRIATLEELTKSIEDKRQDLENEYSTKSAFLEKIKKSRIFNANQLKNLYSNSTDVNDSGVLDFLTTTSLREMRGKLFAPIKGSINEKFGYHNEAEFSAFKNMGVFIGSEPDQKVSSIYLGKVIEKNHIKGLGEFLIVDHGENYYSVYGNLKEVSVKVGDVVQAAQVIAKVDQRYINNQTGLYFELRHYSNVLNPQQWIGGWDESKTAN